MRRYTVRIAFEVMTPDDEVRVRLHDESLAKRVAAVLNAKIDAARAESHKPPSIESVRAANRARQQRHRAKGRV